MSCEYTLLLVSSLRRRKPKKAKVIAAQIILKSNLDVCGTARTQKNRLKVMYCNRQAGASRANLGTFYVSTDKFKAGPLFEIELITVPYMEMSDSCKIIFNGGIFNGPSQKSTGWHQLARFRSVERAEVQGTLFTGAVCLSR